jgi:four helix bundle protein
MESPAQGGSIMSVESYRDLVAWQKGMDLVEALYRASQQWPREELYGLTNQARRAAVSIPANIAEGHGRRGSTEMKHFLSMADGSLKELETHLLIAERLSYMNHADTQALLLVCAEVGRIIGGLMRSMR